MTMNNSSEEIDVRSITFAREVNASGIYAMCIGDPGPPVGLNTASTIALHAVICGNRGSYFDLSRGGWLCSDCADREYERDDDGHYESLWLLDHHDLFEFTLAQNNGEPLISQSELTQILLRIIEKRILEIHRDEEPNGCVEGYFERFWRHINESSTYQLRLSIQEQCNFTLN
jgi:hypothetical protein